MRKKGFTLVELLVVIAIIAMLLAILMPALAKVKTLAYQMLCGTNLKGVANAILVYSQDNSEKYPVAGPAGVTWNAKSTTNPADELSAQTTPWQWDNTAKPTAAQNKATVSACLYLLVKYADVSPASFVCKASKQKKLNVTYSQSTNADARERGTTPTGTAVQGKDATECWDFSNCPSRYCSYAYAYPWDTKYLLTSSTKSGVAVAGDLNPWIDGGDTPVWNTGMKVGAGASGFSNTATPPVYDPPQLIVAADKTTFTSGNSTTHDNGAGQNILFNDMHVEFSKQPNPDSAIQNDNVYTPWNTAATTEMPKRQKGIQPTTVVIGATGSPQNKEDSYLVQW